MIGRTLAHYKIEAAIGSGGMGEVYRATDTKLNRDVALKVLPDAFARDAERMSRFQREAQVLASLNHPNIASIYEIEEASDTRALVMELVEGQTLAERIVGAGLKPAPADDALVIARQIAEALEYAHDRGIIHRDLKPANIKITPEGTAKVLDFGLAKALDADASTSSLNVSNSPTLTVAATQAGVIIGTAAYMAPEQARGKAADRRADIWSFGCILYEMLSGRTLFDGETVSDTLAAVLTREPDWSGLPTILPPRLRELIRRCLTKDLKQRLQSIGEARIAIEAAISGAPEGGADFKSTPTDSAGPGPAGLPVQRFLPWAVAGALAVALVAVIALWKFSIPAPAAPVELNLDIPSPQRLVLVNCLRRWWLRIGLRG